MVLISHTDPILDDAGTTADSFQRRHQLLCRWQTHLEFFLYQFCRTVAPVLIDECHWSCPEAAELSRLSEKVTEFFCFHHKVIFQSCGISGKERESFCSDLHMIRQIRHCAVHRVAVNAATIGKYAKSAQNVLAILKRLGGAEFEKVVGGQLDQFLSTFWDIRGDHIPQIASYQSAKQQSDYSDPENLLAETRAMNFRRTLELQNAAMERKLENIGRMIEAVEISLTRKASRKARFSQQNEESQKKRIERAQRNQKEREDAEQRRQERASQLSRKRNEAAQENAEHS